jgi:hypothetical protein
VAFPTTGVLDDFNRAGPGVGANWSNDPFHGGSTAYAIQGSTVVGATGYSEEWWNAATYGPDCELFVTVVTKPTEGSSGQGFWVNSRLVQPSAAASTADGYDVFVSTLVGTDKVQIMRYDNAISTVLTPDTLTQEFASGESLGIEIIGTTITAYRKSGGTWSSIGSRTDGTYSAAGFLSFGWSDSGTNPGRFDDFGGGTVVAAAATNAPRTFNAIPFMQGVI